MYLQYENFFDLTETTDAEGYFSNDAQDERIFEDWDVACIESTERIHLFRGRLRLKRLRQKVQSLNISVSLPIQLPPGIQTQDLPSNIQQVLQQLLQRGSNRLRNQILRQINVQMSVTGINQKIIGGKWIEFTEN